MGLGEVEPAIREGVESRLEALAQGRSDLIDVRIAGHESRHHRVAERGVRIAAQVRGHPLVAEAQGSDLPQLLTTALERFERELSELRDRRRDRRKQGERDVPTGSPEP